MEEMMACLLAEMKINQAKTNANLKEMRVSQKLLKEEMLAKLNGHHERMMARMDSHQLYKMEAHLATMGARGWRGGGRGIQKKQSPSWCIRKSLRKRLW
jgi:hypothetical protein